MGDALNPHTLTAFVEELGELRKEAVSIPGILEGGRAVLSKLPFVKNPGRAAAMAHIGRQSRELIGTPMEIGSRLLHPIEGMKEGWKMMAPTNQIARKAQQMGFANPTEAISAIKKLGPEHQGKIKELVGSGLTGARHSAMLDPSTSLGTAWKSGKMKGLAEELSRRGWTGETKYTKYLPVGMKSWVPGFSAAAIPGIVNAPPPGKTGEGSTLERGMGELGSAAGLVLTGGLGIIPGAIGWNLSQKAGRRAGRVLDRLRAGSSMDQAINAPSPTEAAQQLSRIEQTYG